MIELRHNTASKEETKPGHESENSPGVQLQRARKAAGLDVASVATVLHISENYVHALENDRYEYLPIEPFVLGYLRAYSKLVGLAPQTVIESYRIYREELNNAIEPVLNNSQGVYGGHFSLKDTVHRNHNAIIVALLALLALALLYFIFSDSADDQGKPEVKTGSVMVNQPATASGQDTDAPGPVVDSSEGAVLSAAAGAQPGQSSVDNSAALATPEVAAATVSGAASAQPVVARDQLKLEFSGECWLEVIDADGDVLATNLYQQGDSLQLEGRAPFKVVFGNYHAVKVQLNNASVALVSPDNKKSLKTTIGKNRN